MYLKGSFARVNLRLNRTGNLEDKASLDPRESALGLSDGGVHSDEFV